MTEQQVSNVCGSSLSTGGTSNATVSGCEKKCGDKICTYNCCKGSGCGEKGCHGHVVGLTAGGGKTKTALPASVMKEIKAMSVAPSRKTPAVGATTATQVKSGGSTLQTQGSDPNRMRPKTMQQQNITTTKPATTPPAR
jgi:hypothetical protein